MIFILIIISLGIPLMLYKYNFKTGAYIMLVGFLAEFILFTLNNSYYQMITIQNTYIFLIIGLLIMPCYIIGATLAFLQFKQEKMTMIK